MSLITNPLKLSHHFIAQVNISVDAYHWSHAMHLAAFP